MRRSSKAAVRLLRLERNVRVQEVQLDASWLHQSPLHRPVAQIGRSSDRTRSDKDSLFARDERGSGTRAWSA